VTPTMAIGVTLETLVIAASSVVRRTTLLAAILCSLAGTVLLTAAASAARVHVFERSMGTLGSGAGQMNLRATGEGVAGSGVAVSATSHLVYVADTENHRVDEFKDDGTFVRAWGWGVGGGSEFEVCMSSCAAGISGSEPGQFVAPAFVAVDNSGGSSGGAVYVDDTADNVVSKFTAEGALVGTWGNNGPLETPNGQLKGAPIGAGGTVAAFGELVGIAADSAGALDVLEKPGGEEPFHKMFQFAQDGTFITGFGTPRGSRPDGLAIDGKGQFFKVNGGGSVEQLAGAGGDVGQVTPEEGEAGRESFTPAGVAAYGSEPELFVAESTAVKRYAFTGTGEVVQPGGGAPCPVKPNPEFLSGFGCAPTETFGSSRLTAGGGAGVGVDASNATVYALDAAVGHVDAFPLEPPGPPAVANETVSEVTDDSARLEAEINPRSVAGEAGTEFRFEYGPCSGAPSSCLAGGYGSNTPVQSLPPSFEVGTVSAPLQGLRAGTTYHFRVVASNSHGLVEGAEHSFTTRSTGEFQLPDGRRWEMVSPSEMHGALIKPLGAPGLGIGATQAASQGGALTYAASSPTEREPAGYSSIQQMLSIRGAEGWSSQNVALPHAAAAASGNFPEVRIFSEDLSLVAMQPLDPFIPLSKAASEQTAYLRDDASGAYTPLVTGCPALGTPCTPAVEEHADVAPGTVFGQTAFGGGACPPAEVQCGPEFVGGTPDLAHVVLTAFVALKPGANAKALYEWGTGRPAAQQLQLVSLLPPGEPGGAELPAEEPHLGFSNGIPDQRGAVSAGGSHVFFTAGSHLYMRDTVAERSLEIDLPEPGCATCGRGAQAPEFQFASSDGVRVFFTDTQKLTSDGGEYPNPRSGSHGADLYVCEVHEDACALTNLAPSGGVLGELTGASEDGSQVYFAANGALTPGAVRGACKNGSLSTEAAPAATCDLYAESYKAGVWGPPRVVAALSGNDELDWAQIVESLVARVSPGGGWLAFMSQRALTGYDNRDTVSGRPDQEVFLYDALQGRLSCVSCDPSGARPHGVEYGAGGVNVPLLGNAGWTPDTWLGGSIPAWASYKDKQAIYQPRYLSDSGRLFFDSPGGLVSKDVNGTGDVYEYEPAGVGGCSASAGSGGVAFKLGGELAPGVIESAGCVGLVSSGSSSEESAFLDASEAGGDVFFISTARLSPFDTEGGLTTYDAHECTSSSPCTPRPPPPTPACSTEASCKAAPSPQPSIFGPSGSATFSGLGNVVPLPTKHKTAAEVRAEKLASALKACHRLKKRKRQHCKKRAHRKYLAYSHRNTTSSSSRRTGQ
jgi:hypothetical protein